jgi:hypothetical protein
MAIFRCISINCLNLTSHGYFLVGVASAATKRAFPLVNVGIIDGVPLIQSMITISSKRILIPFNFRIRKAMSQA